MQQRSNRITEQGQAMTEFLIAASFFLIPLFLGMSLMAKYIDIKQTNIQAARYQAWEYTVWYANNRDRLPISSSDGELMSGFTAVDQPIKSTLETQKETKQRFYRNPGDEDTTFPILNTDKATDWTATTSANPLWRNHRGMPLYGGIDGNLDNLASSDDTPTDTIPVVGDLINFLMDGIAMAYGLVGELLSGAGSNVGFNAINTDGYAVASESMEIATNPVFNRMAGDPANRAFSLDGSNTNTMTITTTASVLTDAWSAGGAEHVFRQAGGTAPTTAIAALLNEIPGFDVAMALFTVLAPELSPCDAPFGLNQAAQPHGSFWLGYLDIDAVHPDRLLPDISDPDTTNGTHSCNDAGMCDLEPVIPRPPVVDRECDRF